MQGGNLEEVTESFNRILKEKNDTIEELKNQLNDNERVKKASKLSGPVFHYFYFIYP